MGNGAVTTAQTPVAAQSQCRFPLPVSSICVLYLCPLLVCSTRPAAPACLPCLRQSGPHAGAELRAKEKALSFDKAFTGVFGRCERIRTSDPLHPMQMRYLAALHTDGVSSADGGRVYGDDPALSTRKREQNPVYGAFACFTNDQRLKVSRLPKIPSLT